jgi:hypothetical protein
MNEPHDHQTSMTALDSGDNSRMQLIDHGVAEQGTMSW